MNARAKPEILRLELKRVVQAPRDKVFAAWTDPERLAKWFCPPSTDNVLSEVDLRVGGRYRIGMKDRETGETHITGGTYREILPPERLVFTWLWEGQNPETHETLVAIDFVDQGAQTEVRLQHEGFPDQNMCDRHQQGWQGCLQNLDRLF